MRILSLRYGPRVLAGAARRILRDRFPFDRLAGSTRAFLPSRLSLELTYLCDGGCRVCCQSGPGAVTLPAPAPPSGFLDAGLVERLLDEVKGYAPTVYLTGGEPLLHPGVLDIVRAVKRRGLYCSINTNGSRLGELGGALAATGIDKVIVSADVSREAYAGGRRLSYDRLREGLLALAGGSRRSRGPRLSLNVVVTEANHASLPKIRETARDLGVASVSIQHLMFSTRALIAEHRAVLEAELGGQGPYGNAVADPPAIDAAALAAGLRELAANPGGLAITVTPPLPESLLARYYAGAAVPIPGRCLAPWTTAIVTPDGAASPCHPVRLGSLAQEPLRSLWNNATAREFRRLLMRRAHLPDCARCCGRSFTS